ncbi:MAG: hypothetical protein JGK15_29940 [Microcoleus sp. PH2017_33_LGB_O_A]|uniref:hypothetical protein n=1 Tax=Microcoleus sp. PH2017_33_LGB_O_A TaxID=2798843 RepID=UPI001DEDEB81|nr:hypothetical protein [Microcoleus sp. PH2017_33_LGB_O_A]MCC3644776.1 hypothetical protein [Microcoleus sp. PH2017_33_LGB_O_A]
MSARDGVEKLAKIAGNPTVRASPLAWKNTHRSRIKIGKNRWKSYSASVPARVEKYPSLADQNWQKSLEIPQCERPRSRGKIPIARGSKLAKRKIPIARVEKYPSLAWKNTHRSRGKIPIARVEKSTSIRYKNQHQSCGKINI